MTDTLQAALIAGSAAIIGGLIGGLVSGAYRHAQDYFTRPQLELEFDPKDDKVEASWTGQYAFNGVIFRAKLTNKGRRAARGCRVFVTAINEQHQPASAQTSFRDSRQAPWAGWTFDSRSVPNGINYYTDFLRISKETSGWIFPFERTMEIDHALGEFRGTYQFRLTAVADNAKPISIIIAIVYDGDWHALRAWKL
jgi:hypothetical protein